MAESCYNLPRNNYSTQKKNLRIVQPWRCEKADISMGSKIRDSCRKKLAKLQLILLYRKKNTLIFLKLWLQSIDACLRLVRHFWQKSEVSRGQNCGATATRALCLGCCTLCMHCTIHQDIKINNSIMMTQLLMKVKLYCSWKRNLRWQQRRVTTNSHHLA